MYSVCVKCTYIVYIYIQKETDIYSHFWKHEENISVCIYLYQHIHMGSTSRVTYHTLICCMCTWISISLPFINSKTIWKKIKSYQLNQVLELKPNITVITSCIYGNLKYQKINYNESMILNHIYQAL